MTTLVNKGEVFPKLICHDPEALQVRFYSKNIMDFYTKDETMDFTPTMMAFRIKTMNFALMMMNSTPKPMDLTPAMMNSTPKPMDLTPKMMGFITKLMGFAVGGASDRANPVRDCWSG